MAITCVLLAAGLSRRFGSNKLTHPQPDGDTLLARALRACGDRPIVAVCLPETAAALVDTRARVIVNHDPDRGMAHSLALADAAIDPHETLAVLPADLACVEPADIDAIVAALGDADVAFPRRDDGTPGHPVLFSPLARRGIAGLPDGDTIRELRDRTDLRQAIVGRENAGPFVDVDTPADLCALR